MLQEQLGDLFERYTGLRLLTMDALYAGLSLSVVSSGCTMMKQPIRGLLASDLLLPRPCICALDGACRGLVCHFIRMLPS